MKKENHKSMFPGYLFAAIATAIWSANFIIARGLSESISPIGLAFWRWVTAVIALLPLALKPLLAEWQVLKKHLPYLSIVSFLGVSIFNTLIYFAGQTTTAINLSLISITFPVFVVILSRVFLGEQITLNKAGGILLVATGIIWLVCRGDIGRLLNISFAIGDLWMLLAAITFAIYSMLIKLKPKNISIWAFQLSTFIIGLTLLLPIFLWDSLSSPQIVFDFKTMGAILYVGVFASLTAFVLWNKSIEKIGPAKAGMIYYTLPLFSAVLGHFILGEEIIDVHLFSGLLILSGIILANHSSEKLSQTNS